MTQLKRSNKTVVTIRRRPNWVKFSHITSIEWNLSSAGARLHSGKGRHWTRLVHKIHHSTMWVIITFRLVSLPVSSAWHTQQANSHSCYRCTNEIERSVTKKHREYTKQKVEEKVAARPPIDGAFSLYQVLKTIGYVPVRLVNLISQLLCERLKKSNQQNELSRAVFQNCMELSVLR